MESFPQVQGNSPLECITDVTQPDMVALAGQLCPALSKQGPVGAVASSAKAEVLPHASRRAAWPTADAAEAADAVVFIVELLPA